MNKMPWLKSAISRGDKLFTIFIGSSFSNQIDHVMDYFLANPNLNISRISVPEAIRQSEEWTKQLNRKASDKEDAQGTEEVRKYPDGFRWVKVTSEQSLNREGKLMGHCVGSYCDRVSSGSTSIYSLRDKKNEPHCTVEVTKSGIQQMQGKGNGPVDKKYIKYIKDFIIKPINKPWAFIDPYTLDRLNLLYIDGTYIEKDKVTPAVKEKVINKIMEIVYSPGMKDVSTGKVGHFGDLAYYVSALLDDIDLRKLVNNYTFANLFTHRSSAEEELRKNIKKLKIERLLYFYNKLTNIVEDTD